MWDVSSLRIFAPRMGVLLWGGFVRADRLAPITALPPVLLPVRKLTSDVPADGG